MHGLGVGGMPGGMGGGFGGGGMNYGSVDPNRRVEHPGDACATEDPELKPLISEMQINVRHGFVRKVFGIIAVQLAVTAMIAAPFLIYQDQMRMKIAEFGPLFVMISLMPVLLMCWSFCDPSVTREYPKNYIFLSVFTACFGVMVGVACSQFRSASVLMVAALTGAVVFSLMLFALQTRYDFTGMGPYLFCGVMCMCFTGFILSFMPASRMVEVVYAGLGALMFSVYIVYDTQMIVGGKHYKCQFCMDDYCFAALTLYLDIVQLFLHLLRIFGDRQ
ncbi:unnamed protein product [Amoebophrya sp. A25]|nr:unnamed protein product [Amoebophrya sp. A25]|eukprot:GSA25T00017187001.1